MSNILVITGAGASFDAVNRSITKTNNDYIPPLTKDIFNGNYNYKYSTTSYVQTCLNKHKNVSQIGYRFRNIYKDGEIINLEKFLLNLKNSKLKTEQDEYYVTIPYLQELFDGISKEYLLSKAGLPSNYSELINGISRSSNYKQVLWLNLNYDLFADYALRKYVHNQIDSLDGYIKLETKDGLKIKYTKPHGSVNWFRFITMPGLNMDSIIEGKIPSDFEKYLSEEIYTEYESESMSNEDLQRKYKANNWGKHFPQHWFPALAAPIGKYSFMVNKHIESMKPDLTTTTTLICIGFSALDEDILDLIKNNVKHIDKMIIVNGDIKSGRITNERLHKHCSDIFTLKQEPVFNGDFSSFVGNEMYKWFSE
jgi:hypothetical protein